MTNKEKKNNTIDEPAAAAADEAPAAERDADGETPGQEDETAASAAADTDTDAAAADGGDTEAAAVDDTADAEELPDDAKVQMLTEQLEAAADKHLRLRADMDNFRKRKIKEMDDLRRNTKIATLEEVLPVMDQFQMAVDAMRTTDDVETVKHGMELILNSFNRCFENLGVEKIKTQGEEFDHNLHEAIATEPSADVEPDHVISEWKAGYRLGDYLLRPAVVVVSSGAKAADADADEPVAEPDRDSADADNDAEPDRDSADADNLAAEGETDDDASDSNVAGEDEDKE